MATLIETAYYTRKAIKYGSIFLVVLIVGRIFLSGAISYWKQLNPPPQPPPTVGFSKLPSVNFPDDKRPELNYKLETVSGTVADLGDRANVYFMPVLRPNLLALERATELASSLGFVFEPIALSDRLYRYEKSNPLPSRLDIDVVTENLDLRVDWFVRDNFLQEKLLPNESQAIAEVKGYLRSSSLLHADLAEGEGVVTPLKAFGQGYEQTISVSEADFIRVDLFRAPIEEGKPNITQTNDEGVVQIILSGSRNRGERVVFFKYQYFPVDMENFHSYPIKTGVAAWDELVNGGGYIVSLPDTENEVTVRTVTLGYYDSFDPQNYFQPVYVFLGDNDFLAIVSAIDPTWVQEE